MTAACSPASPCWPPPYELAPSYQITRTGPGWTASRASLAKFGGSACSDCPWTYMIALFAVDVGDRAVRADRHELVVVVAVGRRHLLRRRCQRRGHAARVGDLAGRVDRVGVAGLTHPRPVVPRRLNFGSLFQTTFSCAAAWIASYSCGATTPRKLLDPHDLGARDVRDRARVDAQRPGSRVYAPAPRGRTNGRGASPGPGRSGCRCRCRSRSPGCRSAADLPTSVYWLTGFVIPAPGIVAASW